MRSCCSRNNTVHMRHTRWPQADGWQWLADLKANQQCVFPHRNVLTPCRQSLPHLNTKVLMRACFLYRCLAQPLGARDDVMQALRGLPCSTFSHGQDT